jgi:hypothetical protein
MKSLKEMNNTEKARLLYDLFPEEMPALIENLIKVCADFLTYKEEYAKGWKDGFVPFDYWFALSQETAAILKKHGFTMRKSSRVFSDQLFYTYTIVFVNDRIVKYAQGVSMNEKFKKAVEMLYNLSL